MKLKLKELVCVGGFFRYGIRLDVFGEHEKNVIVLNPRGIGESIIQVEAMVGKLSGGFNLRVTEVVMRESLVVMHDEHRAFEVAFAPEGQSAYLNWLAKNHGEFDLNLYLKALGEKSLTADA